MARPVADPPSIPGARVPLVDSAGLITTPWFSFLQAQAGWARRTDGLVTEARLDPVALPAPGIEEALALVPAPLSLRDERPAEVWALLAEIADLRERLEALEAAQIVPISEDTP